MPERASRPRWGIATFLLVAALVGAAPCRAQALPPATASAEQQALDADTLRYPSAWKKANAAVELISRAQWAEAERITRSALADIDRHGGKDSVSVAYLAALAAVCARAQGHFEREQADLERALAIRRARFGFSAATGVAYMALAQSLASQGRYVESQDLLLSAIQITVAAQGKESPGLPFILSSLALALGADGQFEDAAHIALQAVMLADPGGMKIAPTRDRAMLENNLAMTLLAKGDAEGAVRWLQTVVSMASHSPDDVPDEDKLPGSPFAPGGLFDGDLPRLPIYVLNLTTALVKAGRAQEAVPMLRPMVAAAAADPTYRGLAPYYAQNFAVALARTRQFDESDRYFRQAIDDLAAQEGGTSKSVALARFTYGFELFDRGEITTGEPIAFAGVDMLRSLHGVGQGVDLNSPVPAFREARDNDDARSATPYQLYLDIAYAAARGDPANANRYRDRAFDIAQEAIRSPAAREMATAQARRLAGTGPLGALVARREGLVAQVREQERQMRQAMAQPRPGQIAAMIDARERTLASLASAERELASKFPQYATLISTPTIALGDVQKALAPDEGLLLIVPGRQQGMISFAVTRANAVWSRAEEPSHLYRYSSKIGAAIDSLHKSLAPSAPGTNGKQDPPTPFDRSAAFELYKSLIQPVEPALAGVKHLYVITAGSLSDLPLGLLMTRPPRPGSDDGLDALAAADDWFADRYALTYLPSIANLIAAQAPSAGASDDAVGQPFAGYGAPLLDGASGNGAAENPMLDRSRFSGFAQGIPTLDPAWLRKAFPPLLSAGFELKGMARILGANGTAIHVGEDATETAVKNDSALAGARTIAFATHGFLPGQVFGISEPGLVLTPPATSTPADDGVLTASEVAHLRLSADWVILSACNTATADGERGEQGLSALARAFLYAGSRALLASHWSVDDGATLALMTETLAARHADPQLSHAQALQRAMRTVRTGTRSDGSPLPGWSAAWASPRLWAPFTVISGSVH
jgi:CHAT domain-containing protein